MFLQTDNAFDNVFCVRFEWKLFVKWTQCVGLQADLMLFTYMMHSTTEFVLICVWSHFKCRFIVVSQYVPAQQCI